MISLSDVSDLQAAFRHNAMDLGVGLYNPLTGDIRVGSFDMVTRGQGHQGLADALGITRNEDWRGFLIAANGTFIPTSHFNLVDGTLFLLPMHELPVRQELRQAGLLS